MIAERERVMSHMEFGEHVHVVDHPLVAHKLSTPAGSISC